jgi:hypothetical protein
MCTNHLGGSSSIGVEDHREVRTLLHMSCDAQYEHEHAQDRPLFPPLFRPELQLGVCQANSLPSKLIAREAGLRNREGELLCLMPGADLMDAFEVSPKSWQVMHEELMRGCDCCHGAFKKEKYDVEDDSSGDDDRPDRVSVIEACYDSLR